MSNHKLLSHTENGYIVRCNNCMHYRIAFGTTMMCFSEDEFQEFQKEIQEQFDLFPHEGFLDQKIIQVLLPTQNVSMILNFKELEKLYSMLTEANLMQEVESILYNSNFNL